MSGQETLMRLKAMGCNVPVIISSGYSAEDVKEQLKTQGAVAFIQKPYTASQLARLIQDRLKVGAWTSVAMPSRTVFSTAPAIGL
jgi:FixJ family two-component response regulator